MPCVIDEDNEHDFWDGTNDHWIIAMTITL